MSEAKIVRTRQSKRKVNELISFFESANKKLACEVGDLERQRNTLSTVLMFHLQLNKHQQQLPPPVLPVQRCYGGLIAECRLTDLCLDIFNSCRRPEDMKKETNQTDDLLACVWSRKKVYRRLIESLMPPPLSSKCFLTGLNLDPTKKNILTMFVTKSDSNAKLAIMLNDSDLKAFSSVEIIHTPFDWLKVLESFKLESDKIGYWYEKDEIVLSSWFLVGGSVNAGYPHKLDTCIKKCSFFDLN